MAERKLGWAVIFISFQCNASGPIIIFYFTHLFYTKLFQMRESTHTHRETHNERRNTKSTILPDDLTITIHKRSLPFLVNCARFRTLLCSRVCYSCFLTSLIGVWVNVLLLLFSLALLRILPRFGPGMG